MEKELVKSARAGFFVDDVESFDVPDVSIEFKKEPVKRVLKGFGGAFTDSASHVYANMDEKLKEEVKELYFGETGLRYNLGRVTIGSCDFSLTDYDYAKSDDFSDFSLSHDEQEIIPFIKAAKSKNEITLLASTWSAPARYKTNGEKCHGGSLKDDCYDKFAAYVAEYVKHMGEEGCPIAAITVQNEPEAVQTWESCIYDVKQEARLLKELHALLPETHIYIWDHNRDALIRRAKGVLEDKRAYEAAYGIAFHWYDRDKFDEVRKCYELYPEKPLVFTEGCVETVHAPDFGGMGDYSSFTRYGRNYLRDLNNGSTAFIDWNLLLDLTGGFNHVGNLCEAPIMSDGKTLRINPSYYAIKHLSHYLEKGAEILHADLADSTLSAAAAINPDGSLVLICLNEGQERTISLSFGQQKANIHLGKDEMETIVIRR